MVKLDPRMLTFVDELHEKILSQETANDESMIFLHAYHLHSK